MCPACTDGAEEEKLAELMRGVQTCKGQRNNSQTAHTSAKQRKEQLKVPEKEKDFRIKYNMLNEKWREVIASAETPTHRSCNKGTTSTPQARTCSSCRR